MRKLVGAALAAALLVPVLVPGSAGAPEIGAPGAAPVVVESWDGTRRLLNVRVGFTEPYTYMGCTFAPQINVPAASLTKGRGVYLQYTGTGPANIGAPPNNNNQCTQLGLN